MQQCCSTDNSKLEIKAKQKWVNNFKIFILLLLAIFVLVVEIVDLFTATFIQNIEYWQIIIAWVSCIICIIVFLWDGKKYYFNGYKNLLFDHMLTMNVLVMLSTSIAFLYSFAVTIYITYLQIANLTLPHWMLFYGTIIAIFAFLLFGDHLNNKIRNKATNNLTNIILKQNETANVYNLHNNTVINKKINEVMIGDYIIVKKGEQVPLDGVIFKSYSTFDESIITGESKPIVKTNNEFVYAFSINLHNSVIIKIITDPHDSFINRIVESVAKIDQQKPKIYKIADKVATWFIPMVIIFSIIGFSLQFIPNIEVIYENSFLIKIMSKDTPDIIRAIFVFVAINSIACPCALGIAIPLVHIITIAKAAKKGFIINNAAVFETINDVDIVAFDKTGTLTTGKLSVIKENFLNDEDKKIIKAMVSNSLHPVAKAINNFYSKIESINFSTNEIVGEGLSYKVNNTHYQLINYHAAITLDNSNSIVVNQLKADFSHLSEIETVSVFLCNHIIKGYIVLSDAISKNALQAINYLKKKNKKIVLISGDNEKPCLEIKKILNLDEIYFNTNPNQKAALIKQMQATSKVLYIGDGLNDLIALKAADLSICNNFENKAADYVADITIIDNDLANIINILLLVMQTKKAMIKSLLWAFIYNSLALPFAIIGFIPSFMAVLIMTTSEFSLLIYALWYKHKKIK